MVDERTGSSFEGDGRNGLVDQCANKVLQSNAEVPRKDLTLLLMVFGKIGCARQLCGGGCSCEGCDNWRW